MRGDGLIGVVTSKCYGVGLGRANAAARGIVQRIHFI